LDRMISIGFTKPYNISPVFIFSWSPSLPFQPVLSSIA
jgi:hypothetical protein